MQKIVIKHMAGSKANQTETFELPIKELIFGRESSCQIVFDPEKDDLVSRFHCKITLQNDNEFLLTDLNSRNKTFVNQKEITAPTLLKVGDSVQLGKGGAQFTFDLDPRPQTAAKETRIGEAFSSAGATREHRVEPSFADTSAATNGQPAKAGIGKNTAMHMIHEAENQTRKKMLNYGAGIIGLVLLISGVFVYTTNQDKAELQQVVATKTQEVATKTEEVAAKTEQQNAIIANQRAVIEDLTAKQGMNSAEIFKNYGNSTVLIETSWKLVHVPTGKQVFQKFACVEQKGKCATKKMPWYVFINGSVEPLLVADDGIPIGSTGSGSGFVVKQDGYILTNRHVAASWHTQNSNFTLPGVLMVCSDSDCSSSKLSELPNDPDNQYVTALSNWVPAKTKMFGDKPLHGKIVEGRNDYLDVTFPKTGLRIPARLVTVSDNSDVALIKIDLPEALTPVQLGSNDKVESGEAITVMGYPGISPDVAVKVKSEDHFNREGSWQQIPDPTVTSGNIGKVIEGNAKVLSDSVKDYASEMGDVYQLTVNATGSGNSGGPVFNNKGNVIGIFTSKANDRSGTSISFAVPIKHGEEIMGVHQVIQ